MKASFPDRIFEFDPETGARTLVTSDKGDKKGGKKGGKKGDTAGDADVRSPTSTETEAYTAGNVTVTGGAGDGDTTVNITQVPDNTKDAIEGGSDSGKSGAVYCDRCKCELAAE
jgi:hypothetical protein